MKLDLRNSVCILTATLLAISLSSCGREPPPKPVAQSIPVPVAPATELAAKADTEKAAQSARVAADKELASRVKAALAAEKTLNAHRIDIVASNGAVTLFGTTETRVGRDVAGKIAAGVDGVRTVENKLAVVAGS